MKSKKKGLPVIKDFREEDRSKFIPGRILLCRLGGIGDVIHTLPLVKYLRREYKQSRIEYVTSENVAEMLESCCPYIDRVWVFRKKEKIRLAKDILLNNKKIDYFFNFHNSLSFFFFNLFYIRATKYFQYRKINPIHAVVNFARTFSPDIPSFSLDSNTLFAGNPGNLLEKFGLRENKYVCFVVGVGNKRPHRGWPFEHWLSLTKKYLNLEKNYKVVFLGGEHEKKIIENWIKLVQDINAYRNVNDSENALPGFKGHVVNLAGRLSLSEVAKIISKSVYVVSCDTGLLHMTSALSVRVVGLFGPTSIERSGPYTANCQIIKADNCTCLGLYKDIKFCKRDKKNTGLCMNNISVDNVLSKITYDLVSG